MGVFKRKNKNGEEGETWYVDYYDPAGKRIIKAVGPSKREAQDYLGKSNLPSEREDSLTLRERTKQHLLNSWMLTLKR